MDSVERRQLVERLRLDAARIADHFGLELRSVEAEHPRVKSRYGVCYDTGLIKIRLNHAKTGKPLKYSSLVDTLCHELGHLRHFDHGPAFKAFYLRLLGWARRQGIYRPSPRRHLGPAGLCQEASAPHRPERRNGVPVFNAAQASEASRSWTASLTAQLAPPVAAALSPAPVPQPPVPAPGSATDPRVSAPAARAPLKRRGAPAAAQQLSLFSD